MVVEQFLAGGLEPFSVGLAQAGEDVLTVQVALGLDGVAVQDLLLSSVNSLVPESAWRNAVIHPRIATPSVSSTSAGAWARISRPDAITFRAPERVSARQSSRHASLLDSRSAREATKQQISRWLERNLGLQGRRQVRISRLLSA